MLKLVLSSFFSIMFNKLAFFLFCARRLSLAIKADVTFPFGSFNSFKCVWAREDRHNGNISCSRKKVGVG